ncbi:MAG: hypothetical protein KGH49_03360 [Candidatus Micrarchaeota archaeon]|nr:hypothetical protein [Candidatus Micrarchaeota archaeon]
MLSKSDRIDMWELQERVARRVATLANDHLFPYQARRELNTISEKLRPHFSELEELIEIKAGLEEVSKDRNGVLSREQRGEVFAAACWIEDFITELKMRESSTTPK